MHIQIYVTGEGETVGRWLSLPMHPDELRMAMHEIADGNEALEIRDFEAPFIIERDDDVFTVNEAAAVMAQYDDQLVYALCGCTDNADQVIRILNGGQFRVYYDVDNLYDVADAMVRAGLYGRVPVALRRFLDYDKMVRALADAGWHFHPEVRVAVQPLYAMDAD
ncbi:antirestriction protein ArdA [Paenibacillus sp. JMULE4]|uniref:antirestriction protein ArdA n=1 Tax=Paenibacillus sp. JMULE4 TaxID=2518342 RepID=UPI001575588E|nr:antirestriction protein ArdA [Paenibacillus sp. JMULE4]